MSEFEVAAWSVLGREAAISTIEHPTERWSYQEWEAYRRQRRLAARYARRRRIRRARIAAATAIAVSLVVIAAMLGVIPRLATSTGSHTEAAARRPGAQTAVANARAGPSRAASVQSLGGSPYESLPFPPNPADRATRPGEIPSLYADWLSCSTGCRPYAAELGWPLQPFHRQHPIRAGLNEVRPGSLHVGLDIQARDGQAVYAVQPGYARVLEHTGPNARVQVGNYIYWHIAPAVVTGQLVTPFKTVLGRVLPAYGHLAFSELGARGEYVNPLRPDGTVLSPYVNRAPPEIARPAVAAGGQVVVAAYSPQTFVKRTTYVTPVLGPAAIAYRLYDSRGAPLTPLEWAFRGTHLLPWAERSLIFAPGSGAPGFTCFATRSVCIPRWMYRVAGGFAPPLPATVTPGRYRLTIYAWDWADNATALDTAVTMTPTGWRPIGRFPTVLFHVPGYFSQSELLPGRASSTASSSSAGAALLHSTPSPSASYPSSASANSSSPTPAPSRASPSPSSPSSSSVTPTRSSAAGPSSGGAAPTAGG
jgi:murein DD-endopeptidase MepM/ murein hydrolase activator NlpD